MNSLNTHRRPGTSRSATCLAVAAAVLLLAFSGTLHASADSVPAPVGAVSFVLGKAWILKPGQRRKIVDVGTVVGVDDKIETSSNGHVHVRFVDDALVSVRPASALHIVRYDYDPAAPAQSAVKLHLEEGVTRAISGQAARKARQNFRMNTPIAAIGVRGTDFVVSASRESVRAQVTEGAIVVAPFSSDCSADTLGPCSVNALELTGLSRQILEISSATLNPVLLPTAASGASDEVFGQSVDAVATTDEPKEKSGDLYTESVSSRAVNPILVVNNVVEPQQPEPPPALPEPPVVAPTPEFTPAAAVSAETLANNQLIWGRWSDSVLRGDERITVDYASADVPGRKVAVGSPGNYTLFRLENGSNIVQPGLGTLGFNLNQAQAMYTSGGVSELMSVYGGQLSIDFELSRFSTSLQLGHSATGDVDFSSSGILWSGGYFHSYSDGQSMAGAVSLDGTEAGYFFEKALENGFIDGLTLWGVQP